MDELREDRLVQRMRRLLSDWLACEDWEPQTLLDWLQGYGLPPFGHDDDPFLWLLRGLPAGDERYSAETNLASRAATVLEEQPDVKRPGDRPDELLYNLFMLSAGLSCPDQLGEVLYQVFKRGQLAGEWLGVDLCGVLRDALISNQLGNRLEPVWQAMLEGRGHAFLPGDEYDGFEGVRLMPPSADRRGEPALDAIGKALKAMARHLEQVHDRRPEFRSLINRVVETYPGRPTWDSDLVLQADKNRWPAWAVECLPCLYIPLETRDLKDWHRFILWRPIVDIICDGNSCRIEKELCSASVLQVALSEERVRFVESIASAICRGRLLNPYPSYRSVVGCNIYTIINIELSMQESDPELALLLKNARIKILKKEKLIA